MTFPVKPDSNELTIRKNPRFRELSQESRFNFSLFLPFILLKLTYADFYFTGLIFMLKKLAGEDLFENYPGLKAVEANVLKQEKVKTYVDKRPVTEW